MVIEKILNGYRYTLSNEDLCAGDRVFPIASGRVINNNQWILHKIEYGDDFPRGPHIITNLEHSNGDKSHQVSTDHGYGPKEIYFKIIKKEGVVQGTTGRTWVEVPVDEITVNIVVKLTAMQPMEVVENALEKGIIVGLENKRICNKDQVTIEFGKK